MLLVHRHPKTWQKLNFFVSKQEIQLLILKRKWTLGLSQWIIIIIVCLTDTKWCETKTWANKLLRSIQIPIETTKIFNHQHRIKRQKTKNKTLCSLRLSPWRLSKKHRKIRRKNLLLIYIHWGAILNLRVESVLRSISWILLVVHIVILLDLINWLTKKTRIQT